MAATDERLPSFLDRPLPPGFVREVVELAPRSAVPFEEDAWRRAFVVVERGALGLEPRTGIRRRVEQGATLWLTGLGLRALHNPGDDPTVLVAIRRVCGPRPSPTALRSDPDLDDP